MTFVVGSVTRRIAFQASDRLISLVGETYDTFTNKSVVVRTADAIVCVGYTGVAFFGATPTDRWIAETAWGEALGTGMRMGISEIPTLWQVSERLRQGLADELLGRRLGRQFHEIILTGLRIDGSSRIQPVLWGIRHEGKTPGEVTVSRDGERFMPDTRMQIHHAGLSSRSVVTRMRAELRGKGAESPDIFESALVNAVKATADVYPKQVGRDVMAVRVQFSADGKVDVQATYSPGDINPRDTPAYSPWVLFPDGSFSPSRVEGDAGWETGFGSFVVRNLDAAPRAGFRWESASRRGAPGFRSPVSTPSF